VSRDRPGICLGPLRGHVVVGPVDPGRCRRPACRGASQQGSQRSGVNRRRAGRFEATLRWQPVVKIPAAFGRRCISAGCVAPSSHISDSLDRRALPAERIGALRATPGLSLRAGHGRSRRIRATRSSAGGVSGATVVIDGGSRSRIAAMTLVALWPSKALFPVAISYSTAPRANRSDRASASLPSTCSGAMQGTVPSTMPSAVGIGRRRGRVTVALGDRQSEAACRGCRGDGAGGEPPYPDQPAEVVHQRSECRYTRHPTEPRWRLTVETCRIDEPAATHQTLTSTVGPLS